MALAVFKNAKLTYASLEVNFNLDAYLNIPGCVSWQVNKLILALTSKQSKEPYHWSKTANSKDKH